MLSVHLSICQFARFTVAVVVVVPAFIVFFLVFWRSKWRWLNDFWLMICHSCAINRVVFSRELSAH